VTLRGVLTAGYPTAQKATGLPVGLHLSGSARIFQLSNVLDLYHNLIPVFQVNGGAPECAHAAWCACQDDVAGEQGKMIGKKGHQIGEPEYHISRVAVLHDLVIKQASDSQGVGVADVVRGYDPGAEGTKGVQGLSSHPLAVGKLQISGAYVIGASISENGLHPFRLFTLRDLFPYDDSQFCFKIDFLGHADLPGDHLSMPDKAVRKLGEKEWNFGGFPFAFLDMIQVVEANGYDFGGCLDRRRKPNPFQGLRLAFRFPGGWACDEVHHGAGKVHGYEDVILDLPQTETVILIILCDFHGPFLSRIVSQKYLEKVLI